MNQDCISPATEKEPKKKEIKLALEERWAKEAEQGEEESVTATEQLGESAAELRRKAEERDEYLDHLRRLKAEFENYRRRVEREKAEWSTLALEGFMGELLDVVDNLNRARIVAGETNSVESYKEGVEMVFGRLLEILRQRGLEQIPTVGERFDPHLHEAILQEEREDVAPDTILEEITPGYSLKGRVLRAPRVKVAIARPASEEETIQEQDSGENPATP